MITPVKSIAVVPYRVAPLCLTELAGPDAGRPEPVGGLAFELPGCVVTEELLMAGRHRLRRRHQVRHAAPPRAVEVVDARTLMGHVLTLDALSAGRVPEGRYIALCGMDVLPACLVEPGAGRCLDCADSQR